MLRFEIKKVMSRFKNKAAFLLLFVILAVVCMMTINRVEYTDENGNHSNGISAARNLRAQQNQWRGEITEEVLREAYREYVRIGQTEEARSEDITEQNKAFSKKQGIERMIDKINNAFSEWRDYDYYAIDRITEEEAAQIYERRISNLKEWLESGEETFTDKEKAFLIKQYEELETPFYYEYMEGWSALLQVISTFILLLALVIGFLVSGIFSEEFQTKADSIFFSARLGRGRAILAKMGAGFVIVTVLYFVFILLYTGICLGVLGADGASCPIQIDMWRSFYNITIFQAYLLIVAGGYVGTLLASTAAMLVSALGRSQTVAVTVPFILLCAFPFLSRIVTLPQVFSFFPDQLLEVYVALKDGGLCEVGGKVMGIVPVILPAYAAVCLLLEPILYRVYKRA